LVLIEKNERANLKQQRDQQRKMSKEEFNLEDCIALKTYDLISQKLQNQNLKESQGILSAVTMF